MKIIKSPQNILCYGDDDGSFGLNLNLGNNKKVQAYILVKRKRRKNYVAYKIN